MMLVPAIAALNDKQRFNSQRVVSVLRLAVEESDGNSVDSLLAGLESVSQAREGTNKGDAANEIRTYIQETNLDEYEQYYEQVRDAGVTVLTVLENEFPEQLESILSTPLCLYIRGDVGSIHDGISIVGTRSATSHRVDMAHRIAQRIVQEFDLPVISGLANGIDEAAHRGAIDAEGKTVAALPGDIESIKPASNKELAQKISENGALLSEVSKLVGFHNGRYLERNRITSGLSRAVIVVASKDSGGTIKQAKLAKEQGKPRFIYKSPDQDGQTPEKLVQDLGFKKFRTIDELIQLISDSNVKSVDSDGNLTFDSF
ncbi:MULTISPECIES: DNA-processing protein DprA [unclassified Haloferax]|uniref:DNA-processing protein DprA n=1 Tax=unclassified Haloferax TaxID=2625095 RepID=UPI002876CF3B|nr:MULTISPECIES: DNA-processing protein DprA [unclassified Haloferax]MDS0241789.1 DNA-protecting protein DprA [Haloferax sp. S2CR25]MDS0444910.1 DNA-protecting protein DprA [Haloferax sp. S2CR25-2]